MTVQAKIKEDLKQAMLEKNVEVRDLLRVVIGEFNRIGKEVSDKEAIAILKKMGQNATDQNNFKELHIIASYLPNQMDEDELTTTINEIVDDLECTSMRDMGKVMGELKAKYGGEYDGKLASTIVRKVLA